MAHVHGVYRIISKDDFKNLKARLISEREYVDYCDFIPKLDKDYYSIEGYGIHDEDYGIYPTLIHEEYSELSQEEKKEFLNNHGNIRPVISAYIETTDGIDDDDIKYNQGREYKIGGKSFVLIGKDNNNGIDRVLLIGKEFIGVGIPFRHHEKSVLNYQGSEVEERVNKWLTNLKAKDERNKDNER